MVNAQTRSTEVWFEWSDVHDIFDPASNQECNMVSCEHSCSYHMVYFRHDVPSKDILVGGADDVQGHRVPKPILRNGLVVLTKQYKSHFTRFGIQLLFHCTGKLSMHIERQHSVHREDGAYSPTRSHHAIES